MIIKSSITAGELFQTLTTELVKQSFIRITVVHKSLQARSHVGAFGQK